MVVPLAIAALATFRWGTTFKQACGQMLPQCADVILHQAALRRTTADCAKVNTATF